MASLSSQSSPQALLLEWLRRDASPDSMSWLDDQLQSVGQGPGNQKLFVAIGLVELQRRLGKAT